MFMKTYLLTKILGRAKMTTLRRYIGNQATLTSSYKTPPTTAKFDHVKLAS